LPISQEFIDSTLLSLETFWKISRPILGIQYQEITPSLQKEKNITTEYGIYLTDVLSDLPAWEAWLKVWDSIVAINGQEISSSLPFLYQLYTYIPWETIDVHIIRDNAPIKISLTLWWNTQ
jgi:2-alkenal reductase